LRFRDPAKRLVVTTPYNQSGKTQSSNYDSTGVTNTKTAAISAITLYDQDTVINQNLPLDPSGVVYDSVTRKPVAGATVRLVFEGSGKFNPATMLISGSDTYLTDPTGAYQFFFINDPANLPPNGVYRLEVTQPAGYAATPAQQGGVAQSDSPWCSQTVAIQMVDNHQ
jgi:hypothetical protein